MVFDNIGRGCIFRKVVALLLILAIPTQIANGIILSINKETNYNTTTIEDAIPGDYYDI